MERNGNGSTRWYLIVSPGQRELLQVLRDRLDGSGVEVLLERRTRERRRGSLGPAMDRRVSERRRQRPVALLSAAAAEVRDPGSGPVLSRARSPRKREAAVTQPCPTCASAVELELPRFPHPPARVDMEVAHVAGSVGDEHYVEIAAFTVSGRMILSQRVPARCHV